MRYFTGLNSDTGQIEVIRLEEEVGEKLDAPEVQGTPGQVLTLDANLKPVWTNASGGGTPESFSNVSFPTEVSGNE